MARANDVKRLESAMYAHLDELAGDDAEAAIRFLARYVRHPCR